jgi:NOL1/NOP2/sun family putative RNA methylase
MQTNLPGPFIARLSKIVSNDLYPSMIGSFDKKDRRLIGRCNTLKISGKEMKNILSEEKIAWQNPSFIDEAFILEQRENATAALSALTREGRFYPQSLSSMLPPLVLNPLEGENVLDLCAAPGSKTTQMAAMMKNRGRITAVEPVRGRFYKLKSVCQLLGADIVRCVFCDGRRFRSVELFDKVLIDAPCSSEGRFKADDEESCRYWSVRKIREMAHKQKGLLMNAGRLLKPGGVMVYSTCTFAPEENEGVLDWFLKKTGEQFDVLPIDIPTGGPQKYSCLTAWNKRSFDPRVLSAVRIFPDDFYEGFFIAKMKKTQ